jgi:transcription termination factor NusB
MEISMTKKLKQQFNKNVVLGYFNKFVENVHDKINKLRNLTETNYLLGLHHSRLDNMSDAELRFRIVLFLNPQHTDALYQLAKCLFIRDQKFHVMKF